MFVKKQGTNVSPSIFTDFFIWFLSIPLRLSFILLLAILSPVILIVLSLKILFSEVHWSVSNGL